MIRRLTILTALLTLCSLELGAQRIDRGYGESGASPIVFAPKGSWMLGGSAQFSAHSNQDFRIAVLDGLNSQGYSLSASPAFCYMLRDNMGAGVKLGYKRQQLDLGSAGISVAGTDLNWNDYFALNHDMVASIFLRNYIPIDRSGRIAMYADVQLKGTVGQSKVADSHSGQTVGTYSENHSTVLGVNPGAVIFFTKHFAFDANLEVLGLGYTVTRQTHNQINTGDRTTSNFSFMLNLLALNFGLYYYL